MKMNKRPILLTVIDGYGIGDHSKGDAIYNAHPENMNTLMKNYPTIALNASSEFVGLPEGQMGNSEVGHLNIGAGRIVYTGLGLINNSIKTGDFYKIEEFKKLVSHAKKNNSNLHILGLLSDGGVHSHIDHIIALIKFANKENCNNVYLHLFGDGRDVAPKSLLNSLDYLTNHTKGLKYNILTISGRYYAMDRDSRWDRVQLAYDAMTKRQGNSFTDIKKYISSEYDNKILDEFIKPAYNSNLNVKISDNDSIMFANFRPDRARQLSHFFIGSSVYDYTPSLKLKNLAFATMTNYEGINCPVLFPPVHLKNVLGEVLQNKGYSQLRIAETEKYAHVNFFFDGGEDKEWKNGTKILINSPKVATYDLKPEMSAYEVTERLIKEMDKFDFIILNFANPDMVGHTGVYDAAVKAVKVVDDCIGKLWKKIDSIGGTMFITADHGNAETMLEDGAPCTKHSSTLVPFICTDKSFKFKDNLTSHKLGDIAPTILSYCGIEIPKEMTGENLFKK